MQIISRDAHEMCIININLGYRPILNKPPIPVHLGGYELELVLTATSNLLINNKAERIVLNSNAEDSIFQIQPDAGRIYLAFQMSMLHSNFYVARLYIKNPQLTLMLTEFQLMKNNVDYA